MSRTREVSTVYRSSLEACGIKIFDNHMSEHLTRRGYDVKNLNLEYQKYEGSSCTIVHYVPSMWAEDKGDLIHLISENTNGRSLILLHGIYAPHEESILQEVPSPELNRHMMAIASGADAILTLSDSSAKKLQKWRDLHFRARIVKCTHPGVYSAVQRNSQLGEYAFLGGIVRPKKNLLSNRIQKLISAYQDNGIPIWVHCSNTSNEMRDIQAWKVSHGVLSDREWSKALAGSSVVLCPYETRIQTVSGLISEAISLGKPVISTDFPFAREMQGKYPSYISIESDLGSWPSLTTALIGRSRSLPIPRFPSWDDLIDVVIAEMNGPGG